MPQNNGRGYNITTFDEDVKRNMEEFDMSPEELVCNSSRHRYDQIGNIGMDQCHVFVTCQSGIHGILRMFIPFVVFSTNCLETAKCSGRNMSL